LNLGIDRSHIVNSDVRIPHLVHDLPIDTRTPNGC
jgi:hypothetical protein